MIDQELAEAEAAYLEGMADQLKARAKQLREVGKENQDTQLEARLEALSWKEAASKKCDYTRDAPANLVEVVRKSKGGVKGQSHHFTASSTESTLFRFKRGAKP